MSKVLFILICCVLNVIVCLYNIKIVYDTSKVKKDMSVETHFMLENVNDIHMPDPTNNINKINKLLGRY